MKRKKKLAIKTATVMIVLGLVAAGGGLTAMGFDFTQLNMASVTTNTYTIEEPFSCIDVDSMDGDIELYPSQDGTCKVVCNEEQTMVHRVSVEDQTLLIRQEGSIAERVWFGPNWTDVAVKVYLPEEVYDEITVSTSSGDIELSGRTAAKAVTLESSSGDMRISTLVEDALSAQTSSGTIYIENARPQTLTLDSSSGDILLEDIGKYTEIHITTTSGDVELAESECQSIAISTTSGEVELFSVAAYEQIRIESTSGDVQLDWCDAKTLWIKTTSGDVEGQLLTDKVYLTDTSSGDVDVPRTADGGTCEITTSSGDISFSPLPSERPGKPERKSSK